MEVIRDLYEAEPRIFSTLNLPQKKTLVQLFNLVIASSEKDNLLEVLDHIVKLESHERAELAQILRTTQLSNVIETMKMIEGRYRAVDELKKLIFDPQFGANERDNLQTHIEHHYWLFGEQFHLVTAAEPDFEQALKNYLHILYGEKKQRRIDHPDKNKEMDIFAVRVLPGTDLISNIIVELKHPSKVLGYDELTQVKTYMQVILEQPEFNADNMEWAFYLVGNRYDKAISNDIENARVYGERNLVYKLPKYKIYVMNWSDVITNFEIRHNFILDKLKLERDKLATVATSADDILALEHTNPATQSPSIDINAFT